MYDDMFQIRLAKLRAQKGVSAREMSLALGQNPGYINNIETGKALPSMTVFFFICDYLKIKPKDFFDEAIEMPEDVDRLMEGAKKLNSKQLKDVVAIVEDIVR